MLNRLKQILIVTLVVFLFSSSGCDFSDKAKTLKDDIVNVTMDQVALQLENSLNEQFPGVQVNTPDVLTNNGGVDWEALGQTELGDYVFYSFGDYEFRAVLVGSGLFKIERINHSNGETYSYAEFGVTNENGKFKVTAK